jgi:hypothetical protein
MYWLFALSGTAIRAVYNTSVCFEANFLMVLFNMESEPTDHDINIPSKGIPERIDVKLATSYVRYCN